MTTTPLDIPEMQTTIRHWRIDDHDDAERLRDVALEYITAIQWALIDLSELEDEIPAVKAVMDKYKVRL